MVLFIRSSRKCICSVAVYVTIFLQVVYYQDQIMRKLHRVAIIDWGGAEGQSPPLNEPICGYVGDKGPCAVSGMVLDLAL